MRAMYSSLVFILNILMFSKLLPLQGARLIALIPRVLPWARSFCPFRACCFRELLDLQPVPEPHVEVELVAKAILDYLSNPFPIPL